MTMKRKRKMYPTSPAPSETINITYTPMLQRTTVTSDHLIYHLGRNALLGDNFLRKSLSQSVASHWKAVQCTRAVIKQHLSLSALKICIPGGKISNTVSKAWFT